MRYLEIAGLSVLMVMAIGLSGCHSDKMENESMDSDVTVAVVQGKLAKTIVENNDFIDVDVAAVVKALQDQSLKKRSSMLSDEYEVSSAKLRAAIYRFYSRVKIEDSHYVTDLQSPDEINVSERVYKALIDNLNEMNEFLAKIKAEGSEVYVPEITEEYLQSLLE